MNASHLSPSSQVRRPRLRSFRWQRFTRRALLAAVLTAGLIAARHGIAAADPSAAASRPNEPEGPVTSDADALGLLNLDAPGLEKVKTAAHSGDLAAVKAAYLDYRRNACPTRFTVTPKDRPARPTATDDHAGDEICNHYIRNRYGFEPRAVDMGKDFDWSFNPVPRNDPAFTPEWTYCAISRTQFWEPLADAYWKTGDEKYAREWGLAVAGLHPPQPDGCQECEGFALADPGCQRTDG